MTSVIVHFDEKTTKKLKKYQTNNELPNRDVTVQEIVKKFLKRK